MLFQDPLVCTPKTYVYHELEHPELITTFLLGPQSPEKHRRTLGA